MLIINLSQAFGYWSVVCSTFPRLIFSSLFFIRFHFYLKTSNVMVYQLSELKCIFSCGIRVWMNSCWHLSSLARLAFFTVVSGKTRTLGQSWVSHFGSPREQCHSNRRLLTVEEHEVAVESFFLFSHRSAPFFQPSHNQCSWLLKWLLWALKRKRWSCEARSVSSSSYHTLHLGGQAY